MITMKTKGSMLGRDLLIALALLGTIVLIIAIIIGVIFFVRKGIGVLMILFGIFMIIFFPDISVIQPEAFSKTGILIGIILLVVGILLVVYF